jgi:predicted phage terminase large subunit-like protein
MPSDDLLRELELERELYRMEARRSFPIFLNYCNPVYDRQWFHTLIAQNCQDLLDGKIKKLMVFIPPQHGKSEIVSRQFPAWALGKNPDLKIVGCSYSSDLAGQFSRAIQRIIDSPEYTCLFPDTYLNSGHIKTVARGYLRNVDIFETVGRRGFYKAVGICAGLTGTPVDIAIIDDPVKDVIEAYSSTYRERVWEWYVNVLLTRLHNDSKQLFIMTRWHDDDLAGRIFKKEEEEWEIICIPAIKEPGSNRYDARETGEALWENKHSIEKLRKIESMSARAFSSLYQQNPVVDGGNIIKKEWFQYIHRSDFERLRRNEAIHFFADTAYTDKAENDPTGIIATCKIGNDLYITHARKWSLKFPDLIKALPPYVLANGYTQASTLRIEPKANGLSVIDQLKVDTKLNITKTQTPVDSKETRINAASPIVECGRVFLVVGVWNEEFVEEVCGFPAKAHDEYVDLIGYAIDYHLKRKGVPIDLAHMANLAR